MKHLLHKAICWCLEKRCGGAAHCGEYGSSGRYLVAMTEYHYADYQHFVTGHKSQTRRGYGSKAK